MNLFSIIWLGLVILLGFLEALTVTLTSIWFAGGALISLILCLCGVGSGYRKKTHINAQNADLECL